jgi:excinuclease ABC subunit C
MGKCLGPCVGAVSGLQYRAAVDEALKVLRGESSSVQERAAAHRDALGEQLRFEEAAELRDRIRDLEQVVGVQQRLSAFADRNLVLVSADPASDRVRLLLVRGGRLAEEVSLPARPTPSHLRHLLRRVFGSPVRPQVNKDELDDLLILDAWLRRHQADIVEVLVDPREPEAAATALRAAIATRATNHAGAPVPSRP